MRICSYNVRDLFLAGEGNAKAERDVRQLARMVGVVDADVLLIQEAGSLASLELLNARLARSYEHLGLIPGNSTRSIHLAVMSRLPVNLCSHRRIRLTDIAGNAMSYYRSADAASDGQDSRLELQRDLLRVEIDAGSAGTVSLFGVHLKSKTNPDWQKHPADDIRAAESRAVADVVSRYVAQHRARAVLLAGDFNDTLSSDALAALRNLGFSDPQGERLARTGRNPSTYWPKRRMRIDAILVSPNAAGRVRDAKIHVSAMARSASDHYPVSIDLDVD